MNRKFTERENEILYERKPLQDHGDGCGVGVFLFFLFAFIIMFLDGFVFFELQNPPEESPKSELLFGIWALLLIVLMAFQCLLIFLALYFFRNLIVKNKYGEFAKIKTFTTSKILLIPGETSADFKVQIFNKENEMLEIKTKIRIILEHYFKDNVLSELEKYKDTNSEKTDLPIFELIKLSKSQNLTVGLMLKDFSTSAQFDFNESVYSFNDIFKSEYGLVYSLKTKEFFLSIIKRENRLIFKVISL